MKYRLLKCGEIYQGTDELLRDDCETWEPLADSSRWAIGLEYNPAFFVPVRRPIPGPCTPPWERTGYLGNVNGLGADPDTI